MSRNIKERGNKNVKGSVKPREHGKKPLKQDDFLQWFTKSLLQSILFLSLFYFFAYKEINLLIKFIKIMILIFITDFISFFISTSFIKKHYTKKGFYTKSFVGRANVRLNNVIMYVIYSFLRGSIYLLGIVYIIAQGLGNNFIAVIFAWFICMIVSKALSIFIANTLYY